MLHFELSYEDICAMQDVNKAIRQQIGLPTLMACGAREHRFLGRKRKGLQFRVGLGAKRQFIEVELMPDDTYTVTLLRLKPRTNDRIILEQSEDVYCEQLSQIVYHMVNK